MTPDEFVAILDRLCLTQTGAAKLLGFAPRTVRRWIAGQREIPEVVARIMRAADVGTIRLDALQPSTPAIRRKKA